MVWSGQARPLKVGCGLTHPPSHNASWDAVVDRRWGHHGLIVTMGDLNMGDGRPVVGDLPAVVHSGVEKAIGIQHSTVAGYVQWLRRSRPEATPAEIIATLEKQYLIAVTTAGAVLGGAAAVPGAGTGLALALSAGETAIFLETTALFTLAVAEVYAVRVDDVENRRALVLTVVLGDGGSMLVEKVAGQTSERWGTLLADLLPMSSISAINKALCRWFITQYPRRKGLRLVGKIVPFGIGAGIGATGNHAFGRMVISAGRRVFGTPPAEFGDYVDGSVVDHAAPAIDIPRQAVASAPHLAPVTPEPGQSETGTPPEAIPAEPTQAAAEPPPTADASPAAEPPAAADAPPAAEATGAAGAAEPAEAPVTGKYRPLFDHLAAEGTDRIEIGFADIAALVTGGLPKSASTKSWWSNAAGSRQAKAWLAAGFEVTDVDLESSTVRFEKR